MSNMGELAKSNIKYKQYIGYIHTRSIYEHICAMGTYIGVPRI